jgi:poly(A) polymerase
MSAISPEQAKAAANLVTLPKAAVDLARAFRAAGFRLALVGGPVRDALLGRSGNDLDFTTDARPEESMKILKGWTDATWDTGIAYGTVAGKKGDVTAEITTFRKDSYSEKSRKPEVEYGDSLEGDLRRRDFTVNAIALEIGEKENTFVDPFGGLKDIVAKKIRTPISAEELFSEDPLRMMRAARFAAQLGFEVDDEVISAIKAMKERLTIISAERIRDEFVKTLMSNDPRRGLILMVESGLCEFFLPELPMLRLEIDEHHRHKDVYDHSLIVLEQAIEMEERLGGPNLTIRLAALLHDIGKPKTRALIEGGGVSFHHHEVVGSKMTKKRLKELRFDRETIDDVSTLVALHLRFHGYGSGEWTDSAVRRYVRDAGDLLVHLHVLTRADCTTRNVRKAQALAATYDQLESRIEQLAQEEELAAIRPDLNGNEIIEILGIKPGPIVGKAYDYLLELRMEHGPLGRERAIEELLKWSKQSEG